MRVISSSRSSLLRRTRRHSLILGAPSLLLAVTLGCSAEDSEPNVNPTEVTHLDGDAPLSDEGALFLDTPPSETLADEGKADASYPPSYTALLATQSPVKSQASRGVCSIFSTVALMEHLYLAEGTITAPDFSEQYLQWSAKVEVGAFTDTEGSNADRNIEAINRFGIPEESAWPYVGQPWSVADDATCTGDKQPVRCYTLGDPPAAAASAEKWRLPRGRWVSPRKNSVKAFLHSNQQAVVAGMTFFYQAWNHRGSTLPVSDALWRRGVVSYPNQTDKTKSLEKRAGHSILIVGWDDELEIDQRDERGAPVLDAQGNPLKEKGFWIFKNSWGKGSFGVSNPHGDGYGYLSMRYVEEYANIYASDLPVVSLPDEVCNDGLDNDRDGAIDCEDSDCSADPACVTGTLTYGQETSQAIPDNDSAGIVSEIVVTDGGEIGSLAVDVDISHTYRGDLTVKLVKGSREVVLHDRRGAGADDLVQTFDVPQLIGEDAAGTWQLVVTDHARFDTGTLNGWRLHIARCPSGGCGASETARYEAEPNVSIPDESSVSSDLEITDSLSIQTLTVNVDITHPYQGDLTLRLQKLGSGEVLLLEADASDGAFQPRSFDVVQFRGEDAQGTWRLVVQDEARGDAGTLNSWSLVITH